MSSYEEHLKPLIEKVEARERAARQRSVIFTLITLLIAIALIVFTAYQLNQQLRLLAAAKEDYNNVKAKLAQAEGDLQDKNLALTLADQALTETNNRLVEADQAVKDLTLEKNRFQGQVMELEKRVAELNKELDDLEAQLKVINQAKEDIYTGDIYAAIKHVDNENGAAGKLLEDMLINQANVSWKRDGVSPEVGFDSPGFAAYMLEQHCVLTVSAAEGKNRLRELFPRATKPQLGDLVFYNEGYTMFYFVDEQGTPFVVGMTPFGVLALRPEFTERLEYRHVTFPARCNP